VVEEAGGEAQEPCAGDGEVREYLVLQLAGKGEKRGFRPAETAAREGVTEAAESTFLAAAAVDAAFCVGRTGEVGAEK
jgi:hypothetical protein